MAPEGRVADHEGEPRQPRAHVSLARDPVEPGCRYPLPDRHATRLGPRWSEPWPHPGEAHQEGRARPRGAPSIQEPGLRGGSLRRQGTRGTVHPLPALGSPLGLLPPALFWRRLVSGFPAEGTSLTLVPGGPGLRSPKPPRTPRVGEGCCWGRGGGSQPPGQWPCLEQRGEGTSMSLWSVSCTWVQAAA